MICGRSLRPISPDRYALSMAVRIRVNMAAGEKLARNLPLGHHGRRAGRQAPCQRRQPPKARVYRGLPSTHTGDPGDGARLPECYPSGGRG